MIWDAFQSWMKEGVAFNQSRISVVGRSDPGWIEGYNCNRQMSFDGTSLDHDESFLSNSCHLVKVCSAPSDVRMTIHSWILMRAFS